MSQALIKRLLYTVVLAFLLIGAPAQAQAIDLTSADPSKHVFDHWYLDTIDGQPAGYWRSAMSIEGDHLVSIYQEHRVESHGGELSTINRKVTWRETLDYRPIEIVVATSAGSEAVTKTYRFVQDAIELTSEHGGKRFTRRLAPIQGDYLTAAQNTIAIDLYLKNGTTQFKVNTLDPSVGLTPFITTYERSDDAISRERPDGTTQIKRRWVTTYSVFPGFEMNHWFDDSQDLVGISYKVDDVSFASQLSDASVAEMTFNPPELSALSVVVPDRPIQDVHRQRKIIYELSYESGDSPIMPISTARQSVESLGAGRARVTVDLETYTQSAENDHPSDMHLSSSVMIDHEDEVVRSLARKATAKLNPHAKKREIADACKRMVTRHLNGNSLAVGDGSASEAARTRTGDCTESAVLLAALLRAHQIPSRCVTGLVYSEDEFVGQSHVFVYHMWTQAWIEDEQGKGGWVDLDSAMWRYSAGHIALGVSAMGDNDQKDLAAVVPMQQNLKINIIDIKRAD